MKAQNKKTFFLTILFASCGLIFADRLVAQTPAYLSVFSNVFVFPPEVDNPNVRGPGQYTNSIGSSVWGGLILSNNILYGTAESGGNGSGSIFSVRTDGTGFTNLHVFSAYMETTYGYSNSDGATPRAGLVLSGSTVYGVTPFGGLSGAPQGEGTIFSVNLDGTGFTNLHFFGSIPSDGGVPYSRLVLLGNTLYGTTTFAGSSNGGTVFAIHTDGSGYTNLYNFTNSLNGSGPFAGLVFSGNMLYGMTTSGGSTGSGEIFSINSDGTGFTNLCAVTGGENTPALWQNTLFWGSGGKLYSIKTDGSGYTNFFTLANNDPFSEGNEVGELIVSGTNLFGCAKFGGSSYVGYGDSGYGTVFKINIDGTGFHVLYSFTNGTDGAYPMGELAISGNTLYGGAGNVFSLAVGPDVANYPTPNFATRFFRIAGPSATTIMSFNPDGSIVWSNAQPGPTYTVQTCPALPGGSNWVDYVELPTTNALNTNKLLDFHPPAGMAFIPAGSFTMGDTLDGEPDALPVKADISAFYMETNLVSVGLWLPVATWAQTNGYSLYLGNQKTSNLPMVGADWFSKLIWCNARSQMEGLTPVYYTDAAFTQLDTNAGFESVIYANWSANGYRLPTEAEWEKAARGGLKQMRFPWGDFISQNLANYWSDTPANPTYDLGPDGTNVAAISGGSADFTPVGYFQPNGYGLYDMAGNAFEHCWDNYATPYPGGTDPRMSVYPASGAPVMRGGCDSYEWSAYYARCAARSAFDPGDGPGIIGFRCVRKY